MEKIYLHGISYIVPLSAVFCYFSAYSI